MGFSLWQSGLLGLGGGDLDMLGSGRPAFVFLSLGGSVILAFVGGTQTMGYTGNFDFAGEALT